MNRFLHPILSSKAASAFEANWLVDEDSEWEAMNRAGRTLAQRVLLDFNEMRPLPEAPRILVLMGKGHNSGDACLAADELLRWNPDAEIMVYPLVPEGEMRPMARQAFDQIADRVRLATLKEVEDAPFQICLDGIFGMQFRPPLREEAKTLLGAVAANPEIEMRVAVDIPSGLGDAGAFQADFTYATGIAKSSLFKEEHAEKVGRICYVDIGFFPEGVEGSEWKPPYLLTSAVLGPLKKLRAAQTNKRREGHLFLVAGSRNMPGALLMATQAAVTSGAGLVTVMGPESVLPYLAGAVPEAMWIPLPETPVGGLSLEGRREILAHAERADALLIGPGMGREPETAQLVQDLVRELRKPLLLDADALQQSVVDAIGDRHPDAGRVVLTPHSGEFDRIRAEEESPAAFSRRTGALLVLKGPVTRVFDGERSYFSTFGGPVLARGGSGDLLAGIMGSRMAGVPGDLARAACEAVVWHGRAAEEWARERGAVGVRTTDLLHFLPEGLSYE